MTQIAHAKKSAEDYMAWGGCFPHPVYDPEVFDRMPGWRQRESTFIRECVRAGKDFTLADLQQFKIEGKPKPIRYHLPVDMTLNALRAHTKWSDDEVGQPLGMKLTTEMVTKACTALGEGHHLRSIEPLGGLYAFIWLLVRYRKGEIDSLPVTALWCLGDGLYELTGRQFPTDLDFEVLDQHVNGLMRSIS